MPHRATIFYLCKTGEVDEPYRYFSKIGFQSLARSRVLFTLALTLRSKALFHVSIRVSDDSSYVSFMPGCFLTLSHLYNDAKLFLFIWSKTQRYIQ